jgi:Rrf2 family protein
MQALFTRTCEYAVQAAVLLASHRGSEPVPLRVLAERLGAPRHFLGKVLISMRHQGLIRSYGGVRGGYLLARPAGFITLRDVVRAAEPGFSIEGCVLGYGKSSPMCPCPLCRPWAGNRRVIHEELLDRTLAHLRSGLPPSLRVGPRREARRLSKAEDRRPAAPSKRGQK